MIDLVAAIYDFASSQKYHICLVHVGLVA